MLRVGRPGAHAMVWPGIASGWINVAAERHDTEPALRVEEWEEASEASLSGEATGQHPVARVFVSSDEPVGGPHPSQLSEAGEAVRVRVHGRGRQVNPDGVDFEPEEEYLVQVWPAPLAPFRTLKAPEAPDRARLCRAEAAASSARRRVAPRVALHGQDVVAPASQWAMSALVSADIFADLSVP